MLMNIKQNTSHIKYLVVMVAFSLMSAPLLLTSCDDGETYAEMKEKERDAINSFLQGNNSIFDAPAKIISEAEFANNGYLTDTLKNEYVLFSSTGIYMQIRQKGAGQTMIEMAKDDPDSTITRSIICRFYEYDIEAASVTAHNLYSSNTGNLDKMSCTYSQLSRSYTASFTSGVMLSTYSTSVVPTGWLKPLDYVNLGRHTDNLAKVRIVVPHSSGTSNAASYVLPYFYEISYELGR